MCMVIDWFCIPASYTVILGHSLQLHCHLDQDKVDTENEGMNDLHLFNMSESCNTLDMNRTLIFVIWCIGTFLGNMKTCHSMEIGVN